MQLSLIAKYKNIYTFKFTTVMEHTFRAGAFPSDTWNADIECGFVIENCALELGPLKEAAVNDDSNTDERTILMNMLNDKYSCGGRQVEEDG